MAGRRVTCPSCNTAIEEWWSYCAMCGWHLAAGDKPQKVESGTDTIIEAAARALFASEMPGSDWRVFPGLHDKFRACARAVLAAATPLIRADALEEAVKVAEEISPELFQTPSDIAAAIRTLKEHP